MNQKQAPCSSLMRALPEVGARSALLRALREQSVVLKGSEALLSMNQPDGFDCPGCAWPDPKHTGSFEFYENKAKKGFPSNSPNGE